MARLDRPTFGKKNLTFEEVKSLAREPDEDGVTRVFPKELWDDPQIGQLLRDVGLDPDDEKNRVRTAEDWIAIFKRAEHDLVQRTVAYSREMEEQHGYCRAMPLLVIGKSIYNGDHGAFLYGQMDLIGFDDWNIVYCAMDERTRNVCGLPRHPGEVPAITEAMEKRVSVWKKQHDMILSAYGMTATGGSNGITREHYEEALTEIREEILSTVADLKPVILEELRVMQSVGAQRMA